MLEDFTGNKELILQANNAAALAKMIKWASTTASMVSAPASKPMNADAVSTPAAVEILLHLQMESTTCYRYE